jgi:hypothetical protein
MCAGGLLRDLAERARCMHEVLLATGDMWHVAGHEAQRRRGVDTTRNRTVPCGHDKECLLGRPRPHHRRQAHSCALMMHVYSSMWSEAEALSKNGVVPE